MKISKLSDIERLVSKISNSKVLLLYVNILEFFNFNFNKNRNADDHVSESHAASRNVDHSFLVYCTYSVPLFPSHVQTRGVREYRSLGSQRSSSHSG